MMPIRCRRGFALILGFIVLSAVTSRALASTQKELRINGTIQSLNMGNNSFLISEQVKNDQRFWIVKRTSRTRISMGGQGIAFSRLRRGDNVRVEGRQTATREILAAQIRVIRRAASQPAVVLRPPDPAVPIQLPSLGDVLRITAAPEIIRPANGARVGSDFTIVGRTAPRAEVRIDVVPRYLVFDLPAASATVTADDRGVFAHSVQPMLRISGAAYRISAKARLLGLESPTATITVYLQ